MVTDQITNMNLEPRIQYLKNAGKSEREIAAILTQEVNRPISRSAVHRFLANHTEMAQQAIATNDRLKVKVAELELDTIEARQELIRELRDLSQQAKEDGDIRTAIAGLDKAVAALDSLDKRLGRFSASSQVQVNAGNHIVQAPELAIID